ncbi:MAG: hypothetical protein HZC28_03575 [Spirochaetes bacterium]|nr:hypothetical protein [Spirochaetota bacterium]
MIQHITCAALIVFLPLAAENLIENGDFEDTANDVPKGWIFASYSASNNGIAAAPDGGFVRGKISLLLKHTDVEKKAGTKSIAIITEKSVKSIVGGAEYTLTFYARSQIAGQPVTALFYTGAAKKPHFFKSKSIVVTETWTKYSFTQKLMTESDWDNRDLFIRFDIPFGEVYIDGVSLDQAVRTDAPVAAAPERKNLVVNPGFELGWLGWGVQTYRRYGLPDPEKETPTSIDRENKYEGTASMRLEPNICIGSMRYAVKPGVQYTFSCYAKAEPAPGDGRAISFLVITPTWKVIHRSFSVGREIGSEWKRFSFPVTIDEQGTAFNNTIYIRIDSQDNTLWVDAVQIERGEMTGYDSGIQCGILMQSKDGLFPFGKQQQCMVAIAASGGIVRPIVASIAARDVLSNLIWKKDVAITATKDELTTMPLTLENTTLGVHEVTITTAYPGGPPLSKNAMRYCVIDGTAQTTRLNPLFGSENVIGRMPGWLEEWNERMAAAAGAGFSRVFAWQSEVDDGADAATVTLLKNQLARKKASGKSVMLCMGLPKKTSIGAMKIDEEPNEALVAEEIARYSAYTGKLARGLSGTVDYFQLLNEPNIWYARSGAKKGLRLMSAERYIRFIAAGAAAVRAAAPQAKIAANINGIDIEYTEKLFAAGAAKYIDVFTFHPYRQFPESSPVYEDIRRLRTLIDRYAPQMPIINDEQYYGVRDMIAHSGEPDRDYYSDTEEEQTGRILQNYLHHIAADRVPYALFSIGLTLYRYGMGNPVYFYHSFGGYRFMSQTLYDITASSSLNVNPSVRAFIFERTDGVKIVSLNTRMFGVRGGMRNCVADAAFDANGNKIPTADVPVTYIPSYLTFKAGTTVDAVFTALKRADLYGFDAPVRLSFDLDAGILGMSVENCMNKPLSASVTFTKMPGGWQIPAPVAVSALAERSTKRFAFPVNEHDLSWNKEYAIEYTAAAGDSILSKRAKLPSIDIPRAAIAVDGEFADWKGVPKYALAEDNLSVDFSGGKIPRAGPLDLSASLAFAWDDANLFIAVKVIDTVFFTGNGEEGQFWNKDSMQIYFDMQNDGGKVYDANDASYTIGFNKDCVPVAYLDKNPTGRYVGAANADRGLDEAVQVAWKKNSDGYALEMAFPRAVLPYLELQGGSVFGISLLVNDNDGDGRKQGVTLGPKGTEPFKNPSIWKTVRLVR